MEVTNMELIHMYNGDHILRIRVEVEDMVQKEVHIRFKSNQTLEDLAGKLISLGLMIEDGSCFKGEE